MWLLQRGVVTAPVCNLSLEPQSHLSVFLAAPARRRMLGQQSLATRLPHSSGGTDVVRGHPARGALPGDPLPVGLLALQGFCASLAVGSRRTRAWSRRAGARGSCPALCRRRVVMTSTYDRIGATDSATRRPLCLCRSPDKLSQKPIDFLKFLDAANRRGQSSPRPGASVRFFMDKLGTPV